MNFRSDFLFCSTGFTVGLGSVLNVAGNYYSFNRSATPELADTRAIASDFGMTAMDIRKAAESEEETLRLEDVGAQK